jgi:hypothetical protein
MKLRGAALLRRPSRTQGWNFKTVVVPIFLKKSAMYPSVRFNQSLETIGNNLLLSELIHRLTPKYWPSFFFQISLNYSFTSSN